MNEPTITHRFLDIFGRLEQQFALHSKSIHGPDHWQRVEKIGLRLAQETGADITVIRLFAHFHDACRVDERVDPLHGPRGAALLEKWRVELNPLDENSFQKLFHACAHHTHQVHHPDPTIGTCWDADRLDLWRIGIEPQPDRLNTTAAKQRTMIDWAASLTEIGRVARSTSSPGG